MTRKISLVSSLMLAASLGSCSASCTPASRAAAAQAIGGCVDSIIRSRLVACADNAECVSQVRTDFAAECDARPESCEPPADESTIAGPSK